MRRNARLLVGLGCLLVLAGCTSQDPASTSVDAPAAAAAVTTCTIPARFAGQDVERLPLTGRYIALTFDAGGNADGVKPILDTLQARKVKATFFLKGGFVQAFPAKSRRIAGNHLVGNHTMTHPHLLALGNLAVRREIRLAEDTIRTTTGEDPRRFFRFPFGERNDRLIGIANTMCYVPFRWTVDSLGWLGKERGGTAARVVDRVVAAAKPGAIVLMHVGSNPDDGTTFDADALPVIIQRLRAQGYDFVPLARVMSPAP